MMLILKKLKQENSRQGDDAKIPRNVHLWFFSFSMVPSHCFLSPCYFFISLFHLWIFFYFIFYWTFFCLFVFIPLMFLFIPLSLHLPTMKALFSFLPFSYFVFLLGALEWLLCRISPSLSSILSELPPFILRYGAWVHMSPALENYQK